MTIGALIDRLYRDYLDNPADQGIQTLIPNLVTDFQTTVVYSADLAQEEIDRMAIGTIVEMDLELLRILGHAESTRTLTVQRGLLGTAAAEHVANTMMRVAPSITRAGLLDAIGDAIDSLSPPLYTEAVAWTDPLDGMVEIPAVPEPLDLLSATQYIGVDVVELEARIIHDSIVFSTGVGVVISPRSDNDVNLRYSVRATRPTDLAQTYAELGVSAEWEKAIIYAVLASVMIQPDLDARTQEFISEALQTQGFPPTTGTNLSVALSRMHELEVRKARDRQRARNGVRVDMQSVL